jgi:hypothetical protein
MSNGKDLIDKAKFRDELKGMNDRELAEFIAWRVYEQGEKIAASCAIQEDHGKRIDTLEDDKKKIYGLSGMLSAGFAALVSGLFKLFGGGQ